MLTRHSLKSQSVTELTKSIKGLLETSFSFVTVTGEISNSKKPYSGHLYFTLKDHNAQLRAVMFKQQQRYLNIKPGDGQKVICRGRITLYEPRGEYQLLVDSIESQGAGQLQIAFDNLKASLAKDGLFDQSTKKVLPFLPNKVSLITSPGGAAVHDFLRMADNRYPGIPIEIIPTRVQGEFAADEIVEAITFLNQRNDTDIIILCRGGGSIEDLWPFNEEKVAKAIHASIIPIVSAIGHEIDFTISDFVADMRAATPTAAAEAVIPERAALSARLNRASLTLQDNLLRLIDRYRYHISSQERILGDPSILLDNLTLKLKNRTAELARSLETQLTFEKNRLKIQIDSLKDVNPGRILTLRAQRVAELFRLSQMFINLKIEKEREKLGRTSLLLNSVSPLAVLGRGYAIVLGGDNRRAIRNSSELSIGKEIEVILDSGSFEAEVTKTNN